MSGVHWVSHKRPKELGDTDGAGDELSLQPKKRACTRHTKILKNRSSTRPCRPGDIQQSQQVSGPNLTLKNQNNSPNIWKKMRSCQF